MKNYIKIPKKIIMFKGGVETLEYFAFQMKKEFEKRGISVFFFDLKNKKENAKKVRRFINMGETVLLTFNFQGLSGEAYIYDKNSGYIWQEYDIPCINIAVDHPYYYEESLNRLPEKYVHISIDRLHEKYFKEYYAEYKNGGFLPLAGTELSEKNIIPLNKRTIDILFPGNYTPPSFCDRYIHGINEEYAVFYRQIIDELLKNPDKSVEEVAVAHTIKELGAVNNKDMRKVLSKMIFIDLYVRNYMRGEVVKTLADNDIKVHVIGKDWDKLICDKPENIIITPFSDSYKCMSDMRNSKIVINVMPWFKDGAHDRVFNAILNGALSVSDESCYQMEALKEGEGIAYYKLKDIKALPDKIRSLLSDEENMQNMISSGYEKSKKFHTWINRADKILEIISQVIY